MLSDDIASNVDLAQCTGLVGIHGIFVSRDKLYQWDEHRHRRLVDPWIPLLFGCHTRSDIHGITYHRLP